MAVQNDDQKTELSDKDLDHAQSSGWSKASHCPSIQALLPF